MRSLLFSLVMTYFIWTTTQAQNVDEIKYITQDVKTVKELFSLFPNKLVFIDLWASWCGKCKQELPYSIEFEKELNDSNIIFLYASTDNEEEKWKNAIIDNKLHGYHIRLEKSVKMELKEKFKVNWIPHFILIDSQGNIIKNGTPLPSQKEKLLKLFNQNKKE